MRQMAAAPAKPARFRAMWDAFWAPVFVPRPFAILPDRLILTAIAGLVSIGLVLQLAASPGAVGSAGADPFIYFYRQAAFAGAALLAGMVAHALTPRGVRRLALALFFGMFILTLGLNIAGTARSGAARWIDFGPVSLQPVEFMKPGFVVLCAFGLSERARQGPGPRGQSLKRLWTLVACTMLATTAAVLIAQPDWGQTFLLTSVFFMLFFVTGMSWRWMAAGIAMLTTGMLAAFFFSTHGRVRLLDFFSFGEPPYQVQRALDALARGGMFGTGPGQGRGKTSIPEAHADFPLAVFGEEFGFPGAAAILAIFAFLCLRGMKLAAESNDNFSRLAGFGLFALLGAQATINIAVSLDAAPAKGMTLPFISYGGSSLIGTAITVGMALALMRPRNGTAIGL